MSMKVTHRAPRSRSQAPIY